MAYRGIVYCVLGFVTSVLIATGVFAQSKIDFDVSGFDGSWGIRTKSGDVIVDDSACRFHNSVNGVRYYKGNCPIELSHGNYQFLARAMHGVVLDFDVSASDVSIKHPNDGITAKGAQNRFELVTQTITIERNGFQGKMGFEYVSPPTGPSNSVILPRGTMWNLTLGACSMSWITTDRFGRTFSSNRNAVRGGRNGKLTLQTKSIDIEPNADAVKIPWTLMGVETAKPKPGKRKLSIVPGVVYSFFPSVAENKLSWITYYDECTFDHPRVSLRSNPKAAFALSAPCRRWQLKGTRNTTLSCYRPSTLP